MKKYFVLMFLIFITVFAYGNWTVLIYGAADNGSEEVQILNFNLAETVGSDTDLNIIIQLDRWDGVYDPESHYPDDTSNGDWTTARRYFIDYDTEANTINSTFLEDLGEVDMATVEVFKDFLEWGASYYPADHYLLFAVGYAYGWIGAFQDRGETGFSPDGHYMPLSEIVEGFKHFNDVSGQNIDILFFDTCLMMNLEVIESLSPYVDYVIGSEELATDENDMGTDKFLTILKNDKTIEPEELVIQMVNIKPAAFNTLAGVNTDEINGVSNLLDDFVVELTCNNLTYQSADIQYISNNQIERFGHFPNRFADLYHFVDLVTKLPGNTDKLYTIGYNLKGAIQTAVVANTTVELIKPNANGISIYFPVKTVVDGIFIDYATEKGDYNNLDFSKNSLWDEYIPDQRDDDSDMLCERQTNVISIKIYPNPLKSADELSVDGLTHNDKIKIFNISGELVVSEKLTYPGNGYKINIGDLASGVYLFQVERKKEKQTFKFSIIK